MNTEKLTWYIARSGGIVAWCLLALALIWGLLLSSRILGKKSSPAWLLAIHRHMGGLSVAFTAVHVAAIMLDDFVDFGWVEVLVPMTSETQPGAVAWGIVGMYVLVAIEVTSLAMRWLPKGLWRGVHWMSAVLFVVATVHGWQAGTDTGRAFMVAIGLVIVALVVLTVVRIVKARRGATVDTRAEMLAKLRAKALEPTTDAALDIVVSDPVDDAHHGSDRGSLPQPERWLAPARSDAENDGEAAIWGGVPVSEPATAAVAASLAQELAEAPEAAEPHRSLPVLAGTAEPTNRPDVTRAPAPPPEPAPAREAPIFATSEPAFPKVSITVDETTTPETKAAELAPWLDQSTAATDDFPAWVTEPVGVNPAVRRELGPATGVWKRRLVRDERAVETDDRVGV